MRWFILLCAATSLNNAYGQDQIWPLNSAVTDLTVGSVTTSHCQLTSPSGVIAFDGFGPCRINIDRVTAQHDGVWTLSAIQPSNVLAVRETFTAHVTSSVPDSKPAVLTSVQQEKPLVNMTCSIASTEAIDCVFRDPSGQVLQASQGLSEGRYSFIESSTTGVQSCGIQINGPETSDLGLWRCDLQTASDTYFGHLSVLCPWAMSVPEVAAAVVAVPTLTSQTEDQVVSEGDGVTMSCSIQSAIRYCYFRTGKNGTIFNVRPGMTSSSMEYVGAGLEAGECGVRFPSLVASDSGTWSCHVGLSSSEPEQQVIFTIQVQEAMSASQYFEGSVLVVEGLVNGRPALDYCRFVRIDGLGFTSDNVPAGYGYTDGSSLSQGTCRLRVAAPTMLDNHPWTVVAKVHGQDGELAASTNHSIDIHPPGPGDRVTWWLWVVLAGVVLVVLLGVFKRHCRWAVATAAGFRGSVTRPAPTLPELQQEKPPLPV